MAGATARPACDAEVARLREAYPDLRLAHNEVAFVSDVDAWAAEPTAHACALLDASAGAGVTLWEGVGVASVRPLPDGTLAIETRDGRTVEAGACIVAAGPWTASLCGWLSTAHTPRIKRVVAVHVNVPPHPGAPVVLFPEDDFFILPQPSSSRHLLSFHRDHWPNDVEGGALSPEDRCAAEAAVGHRSRRFAACLGGGHAFCDTYTAERAPFVEAHPSDPRLLAVSGGAGSGFRLAPGMASQAVDALVAGGAA
jgi:glycine/D-amino acid oxidase-like deaminating enzyme